MKFVYFTSLIGGLGLLIYIYVFNFGSMSETELINNVLYWYIPVTFGLYALAATSVKGGVKEGASALSYILKGPSAAHYYLRVLIVLGGIVGIIFFLIPLKVIATGSKNYAFNVAVFGTVLWLVGLFFFFVVLWPSL